jgi:hypothetical protein
VYMADTHTYGSYLYYYYIFLCIYIFIFYIYVLFPTLLFYSSTHQRFYSSTLLLFYTLPSTLPLFYSSTLPLFDCSTLRLFHSSTLLYLSCPLKSQNSNLAGFISGKFTVVERKFALFEGLIYLLLFLSLHRALSLLLSSSSSPLFIFISSLHPLFILSSSLFIPSSFSLHTLQWDPPQD